MERSRDHRVYCTFYLHINSAASEKKKTEKNKDTVAFRLIRTTPPLTSHLLYSQSKKKNLHICAVENEMTKDFPKQNTPRSFHLAWTLLHR